MYLHTSICSYICTRTSLTLRWRLVLSHGPWFKCKDGFCWFFYYYILYYILCYEKFYYLYSVVFCYQDSLPFVRSTPCDIKIDWRNSLTGPGPWTPRMPSVRLRDSIPMNPSGSTDFESPVSSKESSLSTCLFLEPSGRLPKGVYK